MDIILSSIYTQVIANFGGEKSKRGHFQGMPSLVVCFNPIRLLTKQDLEWVEILRFAQDDKHMAWLLVT